MAFGITPPIDLYGLINTHGRTSIPPPTSTPDHPDPAVDLSPPRLERQQAVCVDPPPGLPRTLFRTPPERLPSLPTISNPFVSASAGRGEEAVPFDDGVPEIRREAAGDPYVDPAEYTPSMNECAEILRVFASPQTAAPDRVRVFALRGVIRAIKKEVLNTSSRGRATELCGCADVLDEISRFFSTDHVVSRITFLEIANAIIRDD